MVCSLGAGPAGITKTPPVVSPAAHNSSAEAPAGGLLILDLFTLQPVTVTFSRTDGGSGTPVQMCTVEGRSLQCNPEYRGRVSVFGNSVVLRGVGSADSGVYTVREVNDGAALVRTVSVTVGGEWVYGSCRAAATSTASTPCPGTLSTFQIHQNET